jgi:hypothetical protein
VYINDKSIIHYASEYGDFADNICIHETTLLNFLDGESKYFVFNFPDEHGNIAKITLSEKIYDAMSLNYMNLLFKLLKSFKKYKLYLPEETVKRAKSRLGEKNIILFIIIVNILLCGVKQEYRNPIKLMN